MAGPIADIIGALRMTTGTPSEAKVHDIVKRAYWPSEPTTPGTIVVLFDRMSSRSDGATLMDGFVVVLQYAPGSAMDTEANGFARWYDVGEEVYRTWDWICERDGERRVFVPAVTS